MSIINFVLTFSVLLFSVVTNGQAISIKERYSKEGVPVGIQKERSW